MTDLASMTDADLAESMRVIRPLASSGDAEARGALADREAELQRREKPVPPRIPPDYGPEQPLPQTKSPPMQAEQPAPMKMRLVPAAAMAEHVKPVAGAMDLLRMLAPEGPWTVRTISSVDGGPPQLPQRLGYQVGPANADDDENGLLGWIAAAEAGRHSCYLHAAVGPDEKPKLSETDVVGSRAVWVDIDPDPEQFSDSRAAILAAMQAELPPFSCIVDSGNGYQGYKFIEPYRVSGEPARIAELKRRNYAICLTLTERLAGTGAKIDSCHSVDHLMRLPGTINFLTQKKIAKGYPPGDRPARIVEWNPERVYKLDDLPAADLNDRREAGTSKAEIPIDWPRVLEQDLGWLRNLPSDFPRKGRLIIKHAGTLKDLCDTLVEAELLQKRYGSWNDVTFALASVLKGYGKLSTEQMAAALRAPLHCNQHVTKLGTEPEIQRAVDRALTRSYAPKPKQAPPPEGALVLSEFDHMGRARTFVSTQRPNLRHYRDDFLDLHDSRYAKLDDSTIKADVYNLLDRSLRAVEHGETLKYVPFQPCTKSVGETIAALKAERHLLPSIEQACWLDGRDGPDPDELIPFKNGIYDLRAGKLLPPDPMLFTSNAVGLDYDPNSAEPENWKEFLKQIYDGEQDQIDALQEMYGYCMSADVSQEKAFTWIGPKRGGKDTKKNVLVSLLSKDAVCGPTLDSMGTNFGMSAFIYKQLAIVGDMRLGQKCDQDLLAENILKLTGRGLFTMDRKNKAHWTGTLPCKLLLISNERPRIRDKSGAVASRMINFTTRVSFYGREDRNLFRDKLRPELPGIALWALEGLRRVRERGHLAEPKCSVEYQEQMARDGSPVLAFVKECLTLDPEAKVGKDELHGVFLDWAAACGQRPLVKNIFAGDLVTATGGMARAARPKIEGEQVPVFEGVRITTRPPARKKQSDLLDVMQAALKVPKREDDNVPF
jgi:P4 family phage/plasmid primase-like protien